MEMNPNTAQRVDVETVDDLAQAIRCVDGRHDLGAGALAEALWPHYAALLLQVAAQAAEIVGLRQALTDQIDATKDAERAREEANMVWRVALVGVVEAALIHDGMGHLEANVKANAQADRIAAFLAANGQGVK